MNPNLNFPNDVCITIPPNFPMKVINAPILSNSTVVPNEPNVPIITSTLESQGLTSISKTNEPQNKIPAKPECKWNSRELVWLGAAAAMIAAVIAISGSTLFNKNNELPTKTFINRIKLCKAGHEFQGCHKGVYIASRALESKYNGCKCLKVENLPEIPDFLGQNNLRKKELAYEDVKYEDLKDYVEDYSLHYHEKMPTATFERLKNYTYDFFEKYQARRGLLERMHDAVYDKLFL